MNVCARASFIQLKSCASQQIFQHRGEIISIKREWPKAQSWHILFSLKINLKFSNKSLRSFESRFCFWLKLDFAGMYAMLYRTQLSQLQLEKE
jgi:hypothetical protein